LSTECLVSTKDQRRKHKANIAITGESPEYFAEYKIMDLASLVKEVTLVHKNILDFGSGIGNAVPYFRRHLPHSTITCGDVSSRSIEIARTRFPGTEAYCLIDSDIPLAAQSQDVVFSACVFHHIPQEEHQHWLSELRRVTRPGGLLVIFEHNPLNPLTVRAVNTCPFDVNARLIRAGELRRASLAAGWQQATTDYKVFFPSALKALRPLERRLGWLGLGAQYRLVAHCPG
jgi:SAM-dependent methyltransferase